MTECKPFKHKLGYVTDREDYVECKKCFRHWKLMENEFKLEPPKGYISKKELRKLLR